MCSMSAAGSCRSRPLVARRRFGFQRPVCLAHQWLGLQQRRLPQRLRRYFGSSPEHRRYVNRWAATYLSLPPSLALQRYRPEPLEW